MYFQSDKVGYFLCDHILIQKYFKVPYTTYKVQKQCNNGQQAEVKFKTKYNTTMKTLFPLLFMHYLFKAM